MTAAVDAVLLRKSYLSPKIGDVLLQAFQTHRGGAGGGRPVTGLSPREREIVQLVAEGKSNKEVAALLHITSKTVETHRANVMSKLELRSVTELVRYAIRNRIIDA